MIPGKPNISKKPDTSTKKTSAKPEKLIAPYEEVILKPTAMGSKPTLQNQKPEKLIEPYKEVILKPTAAGVKPTVQVLDSDKQKQRLISRPAVAVPSTQASSEDTNIYADVGEVVAEAEAEAEADTNEEEPTDEYTYADPNRRGKWSLQHIALEGVTSSETPEDVVNNSKFSSCHPCHQG